MSFTTDVLEELLTLPTGKPCCRKALLFGLFYRGTHMEENTVCASFRSEQISTLAAELLKRQFSTESELLVTTRVGQRIYTLTARSKAISSFLDAVDGSSDERFFSLIGFRCAECAHFFLRGVFMACASITDPRKGYHGEFMVPSDRRADRLRDFLTEAVANPIRATRSHGTGLIYKSNGSLADLLYFLGASEASFQIANICIERDIRNQENRATNCVTRNISRAVEASRRQVAAIDFLKQAYKFDGLPEELRHTAQLRCDNVSASLAELARLHEPPISKSGLNRRLTCILEAAKDAGYQEET